MTAVTQAGTRAPGRGGVPEVDEWLTAGEVCAELKISRRTFDRYRALGTGPRCEPLGGHGPLRVRRSWLDDWIVNGPAPQPAPEPAAGGAQRSGRVRGAAR